MAIIKECELFFQILTISLTIQYLPGRKKITKKKPPKNPNP